MEGGHLSCVDVKEPKKNSPVPRFRQLTRQNKVLKSKKIGNDGNWPEEQTKVKTEEINDDTKVKKQEINGSRFKRHDRRRLENHTCGRSSRVGQCIKVL